MELLPKKHSTNNVVEGWNNKLNKQMNQPQPTLLALYKCLKLEAEHREHIV